MRPLVLLTLLSCAGAAAPGSLVFAQPHVRPSLVGTAQDDVEVLFGMPLAVRDTVLGRWGRVRLATYAHAGAVQAVRRPHAVLRLHSTRALVLYRRGRVAAALSLEPYDPARAPLPYGAETAHVRRSRTDVLCEHALRDGDFALRSGEGAPCALVRTGAGHRGIGGSFVTRALPGGRAVPLVYVWDTRLAPGLADAFVAYAERQVPRLARQ